VLAVASPPDSDEQALRLAAEILIICLPEDANRPGVLRDLARTLQADHPTRWRFSWQG
jgi:hypothetical protein